MKKKFLLSAILISALCLCGCNTQITFGENTEQGSQNEQVSESQNDSVENSQDSSQDNDTVDVQQESQYLNVSVGKLHDSEIDQISLMYGNCCLFELDAPEYPALEEAVAQYNTETEQNWITSMNDLKSWAREDYDAAVAEGYEFYGPYVSEDEMYITRADDKALSAVTTNYWYSGGAHGMSGFSAVNFDTQTGRKLAIEDVIADTNALPNVLATEMLEQYPHLATTVQDMWSMSLEDYLASYLTPEEVDDITPEFTWTLGYEGVTFYFGAYEIGSYADGNQVVVLTYNEYPELFNKEYFTSVTQDYAVRIAPFWYGEEGFTDINSDGVMDVINVDGDYAAEFEMYSSLNVTVNGNTYRHEAYYYELTSYLVKANGNTYIYVERLGNSDFRTVSVFKITEASVEYVGDVDGGIVDLNNSADFGLTKRFDMLSTFWCIAKCYVGDDGMPVEKAGAYEIMGEGTITSTVEITAELVDENGNLLGESKAFPAGTIYDFERTDGMTYVDMLTNDGSRCRLYTTNQWPPTVNGMDAQNCFEMLGFAG
ncbi:MAG: DUF3298 and DUF4163 domain-containing protein [Lachnospiraceae bacterium]|nr:DUF3298 and DUF4163 domain-containing protein [Lachnospiraceae bacterium]